MPTSDSCAVPKTKFDWATTSWFGDPNKYVVAYDDASTMPPLSFIPNKLGIACSTQFEY